MQWWEKDHADKWLIFPENMGTHISIERPACQTEKLYTIVTNKAAKGSKGCLVAIAEGVASEKIIEVLECLPQSVLDIVEGGILDLSEFMLKIIRHCFFPKASRFIDRFHVQNLAYDVLQQIRIDPVGMQLTKRPMLKKKLNC